MKWWKLYSVCSECGVHFEPVSWRDKQWGNLCSVHRKPVKERDEKRYQVISWATVNWERLAKIMDEEIAEQRAAQQAAYGALSQMAANTPMQQRGHLSGLGASVFAGLFGEAK